MEKTSSIARKPQPKNLLLWLRILMVVILSVLVLLLMYQYDNKYTVSTPRGAQGVLMLSAPLLEEHPINQLVDGWAYYPGHLYTPQELANVTPAEYIFIGYYGGFEASNANGVPHGSATYRLRIILPEGVRSYALELPEIFSAYRAYINGALVAQMGNPDEEAYQAQTRNRMVSVSAENEVEIVIAVSDFSHLYSGMVYPPAFGLADDVQQMLFARYFFRAILCVSALTIGAVALAVSAIGRRIRLAMAYGMLMLCFVGYIGYPLVKVFYSGYHLFYMIENLSFCAMLMIVLWMQGNICGLTGKTKSLPVICGAAMCVLVCLVHIFLPHSSAVILNGFSALVSLYEWGSAIFLTITMVQAMLRRQVQSHAMLVGILILDVALLMDRLLPLHEPIITGWFPEIGSFGLVLGISGVIAREIASGHAAHERLQERTKYMHQQREMQKVYDTMIAEKVEQARVMHHDIRHHYLVISGFLAQGQYDKLQEYVSGLQEAPLSERLIYCKNDVVNILAHYYAHVAQTKGILLDLQLNVPANIAIHEDDLCAVFSNLLENAVEACQRCAAPAQITLIATTRASLLAISMENSCDVATAAKEGFFSAKRPGQVGTGLRSLRKIAQQYHGTAQFWHDAKQGKFFAQMTLETQA